MVLSARSSAGVAVGIVAVGLVAWTLWQRAALKAWRFNLRVRRRATELRQPEPEPEPEPKNMSDSLRSLNDSMAAFEWSSEGEDSE